jgi:hypothetical protein
MPPGEQFLVFSSQFAVLSSQFTVRSSQLPHFEARDNWVPRDNSSFRFRVLSIGVHDKWLRRYGSKSQVSGFARRPRVAEALAEAQASA